MFKILPFLFLGFFSFGADAQNVTCATRPAGDSTNACASTQFVGIAYTNMLTTINIWRAQQKFGGDAFAQTANYSAGNPPTNARIISTYGSAATPATTQDPTEAIQKVSNVSTASGINQTLYVSNIKQMSGANQRATAIFTECQDKAASSVSWCEAYKGIASATAGSGASLYGGVFSAGTGSGISANYAIGVEASNEVHGGSNAPIWVSFNPTAYSAGFIATNGTNDATVIKSDVAFLTNPYSGQPYRTGFGCYGNDGAGNVGVDDTCFAMKGSIPKGIDLSLSSFSTASILYPNNTPTRWLNALGNAYHNLEYYNTSDEFVLGAEASGVTITPAVKLLALTGYVKAAGASAATASATVPLGDLSGLGTNVSGALGNTLDASGGLMGSDMPVANPTLSSCGAGSSVDSRAGNRAGRFTIGTGSTTCTVTFSNAYSNAAYCTISMTAAPAAIGNVPYISTQSKTGFVLSNGTASTAYQYTCFGN